MIPLIQLIQLMKSHFTLFTNDFVSYIADSLPTLFILQKSFSLKSKINIQCIAISFNDLSVHQNNQSNGNYANNIFFSRNIFSWNMLRISRIAEYKKC